ncbi:hypothetical protein MADAR_105 [Blattabacterium sp. (Mastotermes darwiniensis) str. MADAR]|jgi:hypothetical protein|nr:hypothetical protein MADAR_105 [Blattabacterium sp. (Mastotermes darwiniensis) str. MADAR]
MFTFIKNFINRKLEYFQNEAIKVIVSLMTEIFMNFFLLIFFIIIFFLGSLYFSFLLSYYFGSYILGFGIITFLYFILLLVLFFFCKDFIRCFIKNSLLKIFNRGK